MRVLDGASPISLVRSGRSEINWSLRSVASNIGDPSINAKGIFWPKAIQDLIEERDAYGRLIEGLKTTLRQQEANLSQS